MRHGFLLGIFLCFFTSALAAEAPKDVSAVPMPKAGRPKAETRPPNCLITVTTVRKSGAKNTRVFRIRQPSKTECDRAAKLHETNYAPHAVAKKTVTHEWTGAE